MYEIFEELSKVAIHDEQLRVALLEATDEETFVDILVRVSIKHNFGLSEEAIMTTLKHVVGEIGNNYELSERDLEVITGGVVAEPSLVLGKLYLSLRLS